MPDRFSVTVNLRTPTLILKNCPQCGGQVEFFSNNISVKCSRCGFLVFNDSKSCILWCTYANECVGEETCNQLMAGRKTSR